MLGREGTDGVPSAEGGSDDDGAGMISGLLTRPGRQYARPVGQLSRSRPTRVCACWPARVAWVTRVRARAVKLARSAFGGWFTGRSKDKKARRCSVRQASLRPTPHLLPRFLLFL